MCLHVIYCVRSHTCWNKDSNKSRPMHLNSPYHSCTHLCAHMPSFVRHLASMLQSPPVSVLARSHLQSCYLLFFVLSHIIVCVCFHQSWGPDSYITAISFLVNLHYFRSDSVNLITQYVCLVQTTIHVSALSFRY